MCTLLTFISMETDIDNQEQVNRDTVKEMAYLVVLFNREYERIRKILPNATNIVINENEYINHIAMSY